MTKPMFDRLIVIGMGLIGSSLLRAARAQGLAGQLLGVGRRQATVERARELGLIDQGVVHLADLPRLEQGRELIVLAVPVRQMTPIFFELKALAGTQSLITDVGSTKASVVAAAAQAWGEIPVNFVPAHPIAGSERNGIEAGTADLFVDHWVILTPGTETNTEALQQVEKFWQALGARTERMSVKHHDEVLAATSHLPHLLAYALVDTLVTLEDRGEVFRYAAGGFRDFTRIAESDPQMWHDILLENRVALFRQLDNFEQHLAQLRAAIEQGDGVALKQILSRAQEARRAFRRMKEEK